LKHEIEEHGYTTSKLQEIPELWVILQFPDFNPHLLTFAARNAYAVTADRIFEEIRDKIAMRTLDIQVLVKLEYRISI
jgi:hypothetical protein